jgi:T5orf172 domain
MKSGYLYVLVHPSDPDLYKIGVTILRPEERLAQHNSQYEKYAGQIVKETGQQWELKTYIAVPDPYHAEKAFWGATWVADIPFRGGVEIFKMDWATVQAGLDAAKKAGVRLPPAPPTGTVRNSEWMQKQLEGTGITFERYCGLIRGTDFKCEKGHEFTESAGVVAYRKSCPLCGPDYRAPWRRAASSRP